MQFEKIRIFCNDDAIRLISYSSNIAVCGEVLRWQVNCVNSIKSLGLEPCS